MISTGKRVIFILLGIAVLLVILMIDVRARDNGDTTHSKWTIIPRMHSAGYFPFTGALLNHNPVADVNLFFEGKNWGFFVFQSSDLKDYHSYANYLQPGLFATKMLGPKMRLRAFVAYVFGQTTGFIDDDSDYYVDAQLNWSLPGSIRMENTLLFYDLTIGKKLASRFLVEWSPGNFRAGLYVWQFQIPNKLQKPNFKRGFELFLVLALELEVCSEFGAWCLEFAVDSSLSTIYYLCAAGYPIALCASTGRKVRATKSIVLPNRKAP